MIEYLVKKRKITLLFFSAVTLFGIFSFFQLPKQEIPDLVISQAIVTTAYPGATPETVEQTVTKKIEQKIKEIQGVDTISSTSMEGISTITVMLEPDVEPKEKWAELRTKVQDAEAELPDDATQPFVNDNLIKTFISAYAVYADKPEQLKELNDLMDSWKDQLRAVPGISDVTIQGIPEQEIRVDLDTQKMQQYNVSWPQVTQAIRAENERIPIGDIDYKERNYQLRISDARSIDALNKVIITRTEDGFPIYLEHIGKIALTHGEGSYNGYFNGKPAVTLSISGETGSDVPTVDAAVVESMKKLETTLPKGFKLDLLYAQKDTIDHMFADLSKELIIAMVAVVLVCMLGLNLVTSSIVALAIPLSIAVGLLFLPMFDVTLNQMTVIGIIIVLSLLVDDAIVVNDNIERRLTVLKESPLTAAVKGTKEVIISIITATFATIAAFLPLMFLSGDMGKFIKPIPLVIIVALLASMVMSLTIVPIFREWNEKRNKYKREQSGKPAGLLGKQIHALNHFYSQKLMKKVVKHPLRVGLTGLLIGTAAYGLTPFVPVELFPKAEDPQFTINVEMPTGTSLQETDRVVKEIAAWAEKLPGVKEVSSASGGAAPQLFNAMPAGSGMENGQVAVLGEAGKFEIEKTIEEWNNHFKQAYPGLSVVTSSPSAGIDAGAPISIRLTGPDLEQLRNLSGQLKTIISETNGTYDISDSLGTGRYSLEFAVNQDAMDQNLVSYTDLSTTLRLITQGLDVSEFDTGDDLIDIKIYLEKTEEDPTTLFQRLSVTNAKGEQIPLAQLAQLKPAFSVQQISHYNLERTVTVEADVRTGTTATQAMAEILPKVESLNLPDGYNWKVGGETEQQAESFGDLGKLFLACIVIIIILITIQFYSLSIPVIILTTVYLAAAGGIIGMFITRTPIGFMSVIGITALAGIVVRNGIVLIEFMEDARHEGMELTEAVIKATEARFRPILLTATAAIFGLLPVALIGDILFRPMAITIISGVIFSTVLTLLVVPSLYMVLIRFKEKRQQKKLMRQLKKEEELSM
ncbi:efflux RND transporter permease subunit [Peribacillus saganii]|uniref:Efflux RND transporter permease subunit n=1 Tax=Peribacillus saganii TaxID=2303992 RepID=A0A372LPB8_9BACI|nr:efflux RND transporter permease subunit [Peribacillus saganii]RFU68330.1 efflux RND transporter permease subunit [Peribacillus saganii]